MVHGTHTKKWEWFDRRTNTTGGPRIMAGPSNLHMGMSWIEETRTHYGGRHILAPQQTTYYIHLCKRLVPDTGGKPRQTGRMSKENTGPTSRPEENSWINYALHKGWKVEQVSLITGTWSINEEDLKKILTYFEVPPGSIEPIRAKLTLKIFDEYTNILKGMYSIRFNGRSDHGGTSVRPTHTRSDHGDTPVCPSWGPTSPLITPWQPNKIGKHREYGVLWTTVNWWWDLGNSSAPC